MTVSTAKIAFGTSGLRGPAEGFTPATVAAYAGAFLELMADQGEKTVLIGADLRQSSPRIAALCTGAARAAGWQPHYAGNVPTPALAAFALARGWPAIMVTGSHIPQSYNGLKFYRRDGEFLKQDEEPVRAEAAARLDRGVTAEGAELPPPDAAVAEDYIARYTSLWDAAALSGLKVGVDMHSAVGRDLLTDILTALGATCFPFRRTDDFVAVDTEAFPPEDLARARQEIARHGLHAVVSTDGDGDRPLVVDEAGNQINGDVLGALTARALGVGKVVTPLTSTTAIEQSGWFTDVVRTRIGSPYVVAAMAAAEGAGAPVAGFEANGGFLLQTPIFVGNGELAPLPTRDAVLPIIAVLMEASRAGQPLSGLAAVLPPRVMRADRLKEIAPEQGRAFLDDMEHAAAARAEVHAMLAEPVAVDTLDGVRMQFADGHVVHFRQSGNAPEMRCYVETGNAAETARILSEVISGMSRVLGARETAV